MSEFVTTLTYVELMPSAFGPYPPLSYFSFLFHRRDLNHSINILKFSFRPKPSQAKNFDLGLTNSVRLSMGKILSKLEYNQLLLSPTTFYNLGGLFYLVPFYDLKINCTWSCFNYLVIFD